MANSRDNLGLIPNVEDGVAYFYPKPNPFMTEFLVSTKLQAIVADWTSKVLANYVSKISQHRYPERYGKAFNGKVKVPGELEANVHASVMIGGYQNDRWVGQIVSSAPYAAANEFGRHDPKNRQNSSTTQGTHHMRDALYELLPEI